MSEMDNENSTTRTVRPDGFRFNIGDTVKFIERLRYKDSRLYTVVRYYLPFNLHAIWVESQEEEPIVRKAYFEDVLELVETGVEDTEILL